MLWNTSTFGNSEYLRLIKSYTTTSTCNAYQYDATKDNDGAASS
jgi:hypothetical protein